MGGASHLLHLMGEGCSPLLETETLAAFPLPTLGSEPLLLK